MSSSAAVLFVVGARPNFVKTAPVVRAVAARVGEGRVEVVHTGQHYDASMSSVFFEELGMPAPVAELGVGSGSHATQTAAALIGLEEVVARRAPRLVVVAGDVNSSLAGALVAAKLDVPLAHVEAGLRSFDRSMPEEVNRVVIDRLAGQLYATEPSGVEHLLAEGRAREEIDLVGNTMIDSLVALLPRARERRVAERLGLAPARGYGVVTLHRPTNVDAPERLAEILRALDAIAREVPLLFPCHPRTRERWERSGVRLEHLRVLEPLGYLDFLGLLAEARVVITDSGGVQEETTALRVPCLTLRDSTERPITVEVGSNRLLGTDPAALTPAVARALDEGAPGARVPELWDGHAAERLAERMVERLRAGAAP